MPEPIPNGVWTRQKWVQERDKLKVPKGAAKVSMGDALDKFHKAAAKGAKAGRAGAQDLQKTIDAYLKAIKPKYPALHDRITKRLVGYELKRYLDENGKVAKALQLYGPRHAAATKQMMQLGAEFVQWEKQGANGPFKPTNAKAAGKALEELQGPLAYVPYYSDKIKRADITAFDRAVMTAAGGTWNKPTVEGLLRLLPTFPGSI